MGKSETSFVRLGGAADADAIFGLLRKQHEENGVFDFAEGIVRNTIHTLIHNRLAGVVGVIDGPDGVVATVGLSMTQGAWYTSDRTLFELWSFVHPDHRRSSHVRSLLNFSKQCVDLMSASGEPTSFSSIVKMSSGTERKCQLYARQAEQVGTFSLYLYNAPKGTTAHEPV